MARQVPLIADLRFNDTVYELPVYLLEANARTKKDGDAFGLYTLRDRSGDIAGICWDGPPEPDCAGQIALVDGRVGEFRETRQLTIARIVLVPQPEPSLLDRLRQPLDRARQAELVEILRACQRDLPPLFWAIFVETLGGADPYDLEAPFWTYAAGKKMHHAGPGELAWHILTMLRHVEALAPAYPGLDIDLLKLAVLCHDLGKLDTYEMGLAGARYLSLEHSVGHTYCSMARVSAALTKLRAAGQEIDPADEENLLHCLASHHGRREWAALVEPATPEAAALSALDLLDARLRETDHRLESDGQVPRPERRLRPAGTAAEAIPPRRRASQARLFDPPEDDQPDLFGPEP